MTLKRFNDKSWRLWIKHPWEEGYRDYRFLIHLLWDYFTYWKKYPCEIIDLKLHSEIWKEGERIHYIKWITK